MTPRPVFSNGRFAAALALIVGAVGSASLSNAASRPDGAPPFIPIEHVYLPLPDGMQPLWPTFAAGGGDILFQDGGNGGLWIIGVDGARLKCITCDVPGAPKVRGGGFAHAFPDGKRILYTDGVAGASDLPARPNGWVIECDVPIRDCASPRFLPIDMSADRGKAALAQRRTFHLSPDGKHIGWMNVRSDATMMVVARLERQSDKYVAADPRAVNPVGPRSDEDDNADRWENLSQLYELKSFSPDGRAIIAVGTPHNNVDIMRIELSDGRTTRLTAHSDWDEDSSFSPDQELLVVNSWRSQHRLDALAWIPEIRGFTGLMTGAAIAPHYVSTWEGFQCDLSPWLLPAQGDEGGRLLGQPLDVYGKPGLSAANNLHGQRVWSPDSRMVILQERTRTRGTFSPNRIAIARLDREAGEPAAPVPSRVGDWAVPASLYEGPHARDRTALVKGRRGGTATIEYRGTLGGGAATSVRFDRFTDDGLTFVSGTMSGASDVKGEGERRAWRLLADVEVSGRHTGGLEMDLTIDNGAKPLPHMTGRLKATYDGKVAPPLPELAPCYDRQPVAAPLRLRLAPAGKTYVVTVTADVSGDERPVMGARVRVGNTTLRTDAEGKARLPANARGEVRASAGDTFVPAEAEIP